MLDPDSADRVIIAYIEVEQAQNRLCDSHDRYTDAMATQIVDKTFKNAKRVCQIQRELSEDYLTVSQKIRKIANLTEMIIDEAIANGAE